MGKKKKKCYNFIFILNPKQKIMVATKKKSFNCVKKINSMSANPAQLQKMKRES